MSSGFLTQPRLTVMSLLTLIEITRHGAVPKFNWLLCMRMQSPGSSSNASLVAVNTQESCRLCLLNTKRAMSLAMA